MNDLRQNRDRYADFSVQYMYIVDRNDHLTGILRIRDLLFTSPQARLENIMIRSPLSVRDHDALDALREFFTEHDWIGVPVTDSKNKLVGVVRQEDLEEALGQAEVDRYLNISGILGGEEYRSMPLISRCGRRLSWLSINIVLNIIAASVIAAYQDTLTAVIALAVFLPMISDMSGCSGNQAVAVSMRELSLGLVRPGEFWRVFFKEAGLGMINGLVLGILLGAVAWFWKDNTWLGLVVGSALMINTLVAVTLGGLLPLIFKSLKMDPALVSGPILTTVTDMCGFFLVLSLASRVLPQLQQMM